MTDQLERLAQDDVLGTTAAWRSEGRGIAIATVVSTWGVPPALSAASWSSISSGNMVGSVSGGCIEGAVVREALEVIEGGDSRTLDFGVSNEQAWEVGLACGGNVRVYVERLDG